MKMKILYFLKSHPTGSCVREMIGTVSDSKIAILRELHQLKQNGIVYSVAAPDSSMKICNLWYIRRK